MRELHISEQQYEREMTPAMVERLIFVMNAEATAQRLREAGKK
tara:strand:+ start:488 stop:616 length:129 start_codon:yes stop_codon:yes gene_type:complete